MTLTQEKQNKLEEIIATGDISELEENVMEGYEKMLDDLLQAIDTNDVIERTHEIEMVGEELQTFLDSLKKKKQVKGFKGFFKRAASTAMIRTRNLQTEIEKILGKYRESYDNLNGAVQIQIAKGMEVKKHIENFEGIYSFLESKIEGMSASTFEEKVLKTTMESFVNNLGKMITHLTQDQVLLESAVMSNISLKSEMQAGYSFFSGTLKKILIDTSISNITDAGAQIMESFRSIIESSSKTAIAHSIETTKRVNEIQQTGAISVKALQDNGSLIREAATSYQALESNKSTNKKAQRVQVKALRDNARQLKAENKAITQ